MPLLVYRPDLSEAETDMVARLQTLAELELDRIRTRYREHDHATLAAALRAGLARVTAGTVTPTHAAAAARAIHRGEPLTATLLTCHPPDPETGDPQS